MSTTPSIPVFDFLVFQPNPKKDMVYYYLDGEKTRRLIKRDDFRLFVMSQTERVGGDTSIADALNTYSFYLWSFVDKTITHLLPNSNRMIYQDNIADVVHGRAPIVKEKKTIEEILMSYGFDAPNENSVANLKVTLSNHDDSPQTIIGRLLGRLNKK